MDLIKEDIKLSPPKRNCHTCCCAFGCKTYGIKDPTVSFHTVPKAGEIQVEITNKLNKKEMVDRRLVWNKRLKISKNISKSARVCSLHFTKEDYITTYGMSNKKFLKKTAVPSVNLPINNSISLKKLKNDLERNNRIKNRVERKNLNLKEVKGENKNYSSNKMNCDTVNIIDTVYIEKLKADRRNLNLQQEVNLQQNYNLQKNSQQKSENKNCSSNKINCDTVNSNNTVYVEKLRADSKNLNLQQEKKGENKSCNSNKINYYTVNSNNTVYVEKLRADSKNLNLQQEDQNNCSSYKINRYIPKSIDTEYIEELIKVEPIETVHDEFVQEESNMHSTIFFQDSSVQVEFDRFRDFIHNEKDLTLMTGLSSFGLLNFLETNVMKVVPNIAFNLFLKSSQISIKDRIVLTFIKLKHNYEYTILSTFFKLHSFETCRNIFLRMLDILAAGLRSAIYWPNKQEVLQNLPKCFEDFPNLRAAIDGMEIIIQKPNKICCQLESYSVYKSLNTVKFMISVSPSGIITYISKAYPGKSSNKAIFEQSKFIEKLDEQDGLMANKVFLLDDASLKNNVQLIKLPTLRNKKELSEEEVLLNSKIAEAQVYITKPYSHLKSFKILSTQVPLHLVGRMDQIMLIICATFNLSKPILKEGLAME